MKKNFLLVVAGLMLSGAAMAQKGKKTPEKPIAASVETAVAAINPEQIQQNDAKKAETLVVSEATHDFGKIPQGKPVTTEFTLKNSGTDSLKLEMVQAGCGCTTPEWKAGSYAPNADVKIKVGYNAAAEGAFNKTVTITYNGGQQKVIYITGNVYATPATPAPQNNNLGKVQP